MFDVTRDLFSRSKSLSDADAMRIDLKREVWVEARASSASSPHPFSEQ
jgi:hypothetical protein